MPDNNELINMLRAVMRDELKPIDSRLDTMEKELQQVNTRLDTLEAGQVNLRRDMQSLKVDTLDLRDGLGFVESTVRSLEKGQTDLKKGQATIEALLNDLRAINRRSHKEVFSRIDAVWDDVKRIDNRLDVQEKKAIR